MTNKDTVKQKNQFSKSLGSGVKSIMNSKGRKYYVLEHRTHSQKHKAGDVQEIIVDYIEIGRDPKCQVRFADDLMTVSRRHAAIVAEDNGWVIKNLSEINQTIVNGRPVSKKWYLNNGDEFQLSAEGPKIGFVIPQVNTVGSLGLSKRMSLFRQQALRPYKTAIIVISIIFLLAILGLGFGLNTAIKKTKEVTIELEKFRKISSQEADSLKQLNVQNEDLRQQMAKKVNLLEGTINRLSLEQAKINNQSGNSTAIAPTEFSALYSGVYQVVFKDFTLSFEGQTQTIQVNTLVGSGFLLSDKRFITARHVVEPWYFFDENDNELIYLNAFIQMGATLTSNYVAISPSGKTINFTNKNIVVDRSNDSNFSFTDSDGESLFVRKAALDSKDWVKVYTDKTGGLAFDENLSNNLQVKTHLDVLGYPLGLSASSGANINPIYGSCVVSADGLQSGVIMISSRNFEHGNSGGPVFVEKNGRYYVIGLISAGTGDNIGFIVPISAISN